MSSNAMGERSSEFDKELEFLLRSTVNYLYLAQFETFRASLLTIRKKNPQLAVSILQAVVEKGGILQGPVAWSSRTTSSAQLVFLSLSELLELDSSNESVWGLDTDVLKLKAEFVLLIDSIRSRLISQNDASSQSEPVSDDELLFRKIAVALCDVIASQGLQRLRSAISRLHISETSDAMSTDEISCWRKITLLYPNLVDAVSQNVKNQFSLDRSKGVAGVSTSSSSIVSATPQEGNDFPLGVTIRREAQLAHIDAIKEALDRYDFDTCMHHLGFLHHDNPIDDSFYRLIVSDLTKKIKYQNDNIGKSWVCSWERILKAYEQFIASNDIYLVKMVEDTQDGLIQEESDVPSVSSEYTIPAPLKKLVRNFQALRSRHTETCEDTKTAQDLILACKRELFHYARVSGEHILEIVLKSALFAVKVERLQEASDILSIFPRLQPLVATMGWDLLSGKTIARRKMLEVLWTSKSNQLRLEDLSDYKKQGEEISCIEYLCDHLCYRLELAYFAACNSKGHIWDPTTCVLFSGRKERRISEDAEGGPLDSFVANFVLERLAVQTPLRVLFDVVPGIRFKEALELVNLQPIHSPQAAWHRVQDIELLHMHYGIQAAVLALGIMEKNTPLEETEKNITIVYQFLKEIQEHLEAVCSPPRKLFLVSILISLLHMDDITVNSSANATSDEEFSLISDTAENNSVVSVISFILKLLQDSVPSVSAENDSKKPWSRMIGKSGRQALEWRMATIKHFIEDWQWRLSVLQRLLPHPERQWTWKEALAILRAAPSTLLNFCMQRAQFDIGEEAVHRFALPPEDKVALQLAEWVDGAFTRASIEDAMSRVAEGVLNERGSLDFAAFQSRIGTLATALLCIDVALTSARSIDMSKHLLDQARSLLSDISLGSNQRGLSHWEEVQHMCIISVAKRIVQRLQEFVEHCTMTTLQGLLTGATVGSALVEIYRQGPKQRALISLEQVIEDAQRGKRQFLSGKLHNLVKAISDEDIEEGSGKVGITMERKASDFYEHDILLNLGFRPVRQASPTVQTTEQNIEGTHLNTKGSGKRFPFVITKQPSYLAAFVQYIATIGDIVDGIDTTHDFNYFTLVYEWPNDVLTRLVFERGNADAAGSVADIMGADLVHEVISACVPPVYPPVSNHGWACIPRVFYSNQNSRGSLYSAYKTCTVNSIGNSRSMQVQPQLYPLRLDVIKHLATLSPVRAVLACVFGSMFSTSNRCTDVIEPSSHPFAQDDDRVFYEFALDQSYRFPTLNRWIQMQANLHRLLDFPMASKSHSEKIPNKQRILKKRQREYQNDAESEEDENIHTRLGSKAATSACDMECKGAKSPSVLDEVRELTSVRLDGSESLFFDWENEGPYEETVERLISEGKLLDALALSDRCLREGASDQLLKLLIERGEEGSARSTQSHGYGVRRNLQSSSWQYCIRLRDKRLAANLALKYLRCWELGPAMDVLTMCICHLSESDPLRHEALSMKQSLQKYKHILNADGQFGSWQEVEVEFKQDPEGLALRLAGKGAVSAALEVAESASLSIELRRELQGRQLVKLLTTDPLSGGGPAEASRFLSSLQGPEDALPVAMGAMQLLPNLRSKQLLVHFLLKHRVGTLSDGDNTQLNRWALGLRVLAALPLPWQQRCSVLHEHPHLILETLLMWKQLQSAQKLINEFPSLMDEQLIFKYAAKSITVSGYPYTERRATATPVVNQSSNRTTVSAKSHFANSLSNLHKEARKAFSWTSRDSSNKLVPKEITRKRKSSGLPLSQRVAWEAMAGLQEDKPSIMSIDGQERPTTVATSEGCVLTGDPIKDEAVRQSFRYESTPDITLFKALLSLCLDDKIAAKGALELSVSEMKNILSSRNLPLSASTEIVGRAYHATETFVQALSYAKAQFKKIIGSTDMTVTASKDHDFEDMSSDTTSSSAGTSQNVEVADLLSEADWWLSHAKLLQSLLGSGIVASLDDVRDKESAVLLRDRLIREERYSMAVYTCKKCKIDAFPVWNAWGQALLRMEHYAQARVKFKQALQLYKDNPVRVILDIINIMESGPPVDLPGVRSLYNHLAKSAPTIMDDSLSADSYLNVLYMPTSFPRSERLRKPSEDSSDMNLHNLTEGNDDGPRSNLDSVRYTECVSYLQEYARQEILTFMFRHGHYRDACLLFFPPHSTPLRPQASVNQTQAASQTSQRTDPLATDYGTIEDLCDLCIGYGAMPVLERVIASRNTGCMDMSVREHTAAALTRICNYCETHRHFNHLYRFQVLKKDHVAAGLCSIQLFLNSSQQEQAFKHLEHAKMHFEEGLSARHKAGESVKNVSKTTRLKNASDKLTEEDLVKFSSRIGIQMDVVRSFSDADGPPWKHSLFGNPNDTETFRRRCEVAETLVERNFDLAFQIIYEFQLPAVHIYAGVAASLAERKRGNQLTEFLKNIKGTIDDDEWDQVLGAAINVFANKHRERPDRLIDMLSSSHRKVLACVVCGRLKTAFQIASRSGNVADVQYVAHQALKTGALPVLDMCKQWLQQYM